MLLGIVAMVPLLVIGMVPILTGDLPSASFLPLVPLTRDSTNNVIDGVQNGIDGWYDSANDVPENTYKNVKVLFDVMSGQFLMNGTGVKK